MTLEYNEFWFTILIAIGVVFISLAILFGLKIAYSETDIFIQDYEDCITNQIPSYICDEIFPAIPLQLVKFK